MRCFPDCRPAGHVNTGFCGRPIRINVTYDSAAAKDLDFLAFCEFRQKQDDQCPFTTTNTATKLGDVLELADIANRSRGRNPSGDDEVRKPWWPGDVVAKKLDSDRKHVHAQFSFNTAGNGWHYAWMSQRTWQQTKHVLHIIILAGSMKQSLFACVCTLSSPEFEVVAKNRNRSNASPSVASACSKPTLAGSKRPASQMTAARSEGGVAAGTGALIHSLPPSLSVNSSSAATVHCDANQSILLRIQQLKARKQQLEQLRQIQHEQMAAVQALPPN